MQSTFVAIRLPHGPDRYYTVFVKSGQFSELPDILARGAKGVRVFIITDDTVRALYGEQLQRQMLSLGVETMLTSFPPGEKSKTYRTLIRLQTSLLEAGVRRDSIVVALGGGVVGDVAGFVAATLLRGIRFIQVPTTLLAQVDSSVGGKVGIDHPRGKNLIGAFHHPEAVYCDPGVLSTLPDAEFRNGMAEVVKIATAIDQKFFAILERQAPLMNRNAVELLVPCIAHAVRLKASIVAEDERESGPRRALNLGHTIGHAIESSLHYRIRHGEAVAMGLAAETRIAVDLGQLLGTERFRLVRLLQVLGLPTALPRLKDKGAFFAALAVDKKADKDGLRFALLNSIGRVDTNARIPEERVRKLLADEGTED